MLDAVTGERISFEILEVELGALAAVSDLEHELAQLNANQFGVLNLSFASILASPTIDGIVRSSAAPCVYGNRGVECWKARLR